MKVEGPVCVCVCVCVRERQRETDRQTETVPSWQASHTEASGRYKSLGCRSEPRDREVG